MERPRPWVWGLRTWGGEVGVSVGVIEGDQEKRERKRAKGTSISRKFSGGPYISSKLCVRASGRVCIAAVLVACGAHGGDGCALVLLPLESTTGTGCLV